MILLPAAAASGEREAKINVLPQSNGRWMSPSVVPRHRRNHLSAVSLRALLSTESFECFPIYSHYSSLGAVKCMSSLSRKTKIEKQHPVGAISET